MNTSSDPSSISVTGEVDGTEHSGNPLRQLRARVLQSLLWVASGLGLLNIVPMFYEFVTVDQFEISPRNVILVFYVSPF